MYWNGAQWTAFYPSVYIRDFVTKSEKIQSLFFASYQTVLMYNTIVEYWISTALHSDILIVSFDFAWMLKNVVLLGALLESHPSCHISF